MDTSCLWSKDETKWMHALNLVTRTTREPTYNNWAIELAKTAHARFTYVPSTGGQKRMYWKISIDLSYPLTPSMGHHDPLDGFITYHQLQATADRDLEKSAWQDITAEIADMARFCEGKSWTTDDPLGLGDLWCDSFKIVQLVVNDNFSQIELLENLLDFSLLGLKSYTDQNQFKLPADYRLAFRELGLSIGLNSIKKLRLWINQNPDIFHKKHELDYKIESLMQYLPLSEMIEMFWLEGTNRETASWMAHRDINMVMLATTLAPDGYLIL